MGFFLDAQWPDPVCLNHLGGFSLKRCIFLLCIPFNLQLLSRWGLGLTASDAVHRLVCDIGTGGVDVLTSFHTCLSHVGASDGKKNGKIMEKGKGP